MNDIIERLRARQAHWSKQPDWFGGDLFKEAADEIERLSKEIRHLRDIIQAGADEIEKLRATVDDLRNDARLIEQETERLRSEVQRLQEALARATDPRTNQ